MRRRNVAKHRRSRQHIGVQDTVLQPVDVHVPEFGACVIESHHAPGFRPATLQDPFSKFLFIIAGEGKVRAAGRAHTLVPGVLLHMPSGVRHTLSDEPGKPVSLYALCYRRSAVAPNMAERIAADGVQAWLLERQAPHLAREVRAHFREMLFEQRAQRDGWQIIVLSRLADLLVRAVRMIDAELPASNGDVLSHRSMGSLQRVAEYAQRLETTFFRAESLDDAADATGLSRRRFTELFRKVTGQSWQHHLQKLRLDHAAKLLSQTDAPVIAVAFECGFDDLSHFHRVFKKGYASSPLAYRKSHAT